MTEDPQSIGRYRIIDVLGRGAMGVIYKAHDPDIDRSVAIKLIRTDLLNGADRADFIVRFRREAQAAGRCSHPNIVSIYDFSVHDGNPFLVMEFVDGVTLVEALPASGRFAMEDAVFLMLQVLRALQAAHAMGIVHRDVKPANILLTGGTLVKVTDFGISHLDTSNITSVESVIGTPSYMSPEQCRGAAADARSDLFSAGIVLYEMLAGTKPFAGRNSAEVFAKLLHEPPSDLRLIVPDVPEGVQAVILRCLNKDPRERFASAGETALALQEAAVAHGAGYADRTIIMPSRPVKADAPFATSTGVGRFDSEFLDTLTLKLTEILGPIATYLVRSAVQRSGSVEVLCASLAANIEQPDKRQRFQAEVQRKIARGTGGTDLHASASVVTPTATPTVRNFSEIELERLRKTLTQHVGPVARVLIKRAAPHAASMPALWHALSAHIDNAHARAAFLRDAPIAPE